MSQKIGIYQIRNVLNNKSYIGSSINIEKRWKEHKLLLNKQEHHSYKLQKAWNKYGEDNFEFEILEELSETQDILKIEQEYLDKNGSYLYGYNVSMKSKCGGLFDRDRGYLFKANAYQTVMYDDIKLSEIVQDRLDYARVHLLAENIYKDTNTIMIRVNTRTVRLADIEDIASIVTLSIKKTREFLNRMKRLHVLAERIDKVGDIVQIKYVLNPLFFNSKKYINADLYFLFQNSLDCYLPGWVIRRFHEIGNIKNDKSTEK